MHLSASRKPNRLPKRFPVGTTYVVEGCGGEDGQLRVFSRYVVLPGGQRINLADDFSGPASPRAPPGAPAAAAKARNPKPAAKRRAAGPKKLWLGPERRASAAVNGQTPGEAPQPLTLNHPASNPGRFSGRGSFFCAGALCAEPGRAALFAADDQIVAMDHLGPAGKAEDRLDVGGRPAPDLLRIFGVVGA